MPLIFKGTLIQLVAVTALCLSACRSVDRPDLSSTRALLVSQGSAEADGLWESAKNALRDHGFRLDRVDRHAGVISSLPATSKQILEFWRSDVCSGADAWEATFNPIRRWVEIQFTANNSEDWAGMTVVVHKERYSSPDRQFNNTGAAYQVFGDRLPTTSGKVNHAATDNRWLNFGRDAAMEDHLARCIIARAGLPTAHPPEGVARADQ